MKFLSPALHVPLPLADMPFLRKVFTRDAAATPSASLSPFTSQSPLEGPFSPPPSIAPSPLPRPQQHLVGGSGGSRTRSLSRTLSRTRSRSGSILGRANTPGPMTPLTPPTSTSMQDVVDEPRSSLSGDVEEHPRPLPSLPLRRPSAPKLARVPSSASHRRAKYQYPPPHPHPHPHPRTFTFLPLHLHLRALLPPRLRALLARYIPSPAMVLENTGSVARDHLASERTFLAYVRTSLALASAGVALVQLFTIADLTSRGTNTPLGEQSRRVQRFARPLGVTTVLVAIVVLGVGAYRYFLIQHSLPEQMFPVARFSTAFISFVFGALIVVVFGALLDGRVHS